MNGVPVGGISMVINLVVVGFRSTKEWLFPAHLERTIKTRDMPMISLAIFVTIISVVLLSAFFILGEGVESNISNYNLAEDISQDKPVVIPCIFINRDCIIAEGNITTIATF